MTPPAEQAAPGAVLARRFRTLLRAYPPAYRAERGAELVDTYLELAATRPHGGGRWPRPADATDLLVGGLRERLRARGASGITDALPVAAVLAFCTATVLAGSWLVTVEPRGIPAGIDLRAFGPAQTVGAVAWIGWLLAAAGAAVLPGRVTRRLVLAAVALTVLAVPVAALTSFVRPPLYVLAPQVALGLLALGWPARPGLRTRILAAALPAAAVAIGVATAGVGDPWFNGYRATAHDVLAAAAVALVGVALAVAVVQTFHRDTRGWWALLILLPTAALLLARQVAMVARDFGSPVTELWGLVGVAVVTTTLAAAALPVAALLHGRRRRG